MFDGDELLGRLAKHQVQFVIVGGFAAVAHGVSLMTQDIDICCSFDGDNLLRLQAAITDLHPVHRMTPQRIPCQLTAENCAGLQNLYLDTDLGVLDCLSSVLGIGGYGEVRSVSMPIVLPDVGTVHILTIDALIRAKEAMDRPRDREAVFQLKAIRERQ